MKVMYAISILWWPLVRFAHSHEQQNSVRHRRDQTCPTPPDSTIYSLSQDFIRKANLASQLSINVTFEYSGCIDKYIEEGKQIYELFDGWWTLQDQALVAKDKGTCYAIFMGTAPYNPLDQLQNINPFFKVVPNSDCSTRAGYQNAYFNSYYHKMRAAVDFCVQSCLGEHCPLILHGHSQGASIATIAAIDMRKYDPITITFGTPRTIKFSSTFPCDVVDYTKQFRFVNTLNGMYDAVVMDTVFCPKQVGVALLLDDVNYPIANVGLNNDAIRGPTTQDAHDQRLYTERLKRLAESSCFPIPATAWPTGHYCNYDDECLSQSCTDRTCA